MHIQPVNEKMRPEMVIRIQNGILNGQSSYFFSNQPFEKRPVMTIQDSDLYSDDHFGSHFFGNGLYVTRIIHFCDMIHSSVA